MPIMSGLSSNVIGVSQQQLGRIYNAISMTNLF